MPDAPNFRAKLDATRRAAPPPPRGPDMMTVLLIVTCIVLIVGVGFGIYASTASMEHTRLSDERTRCRDELRVRGDIPSGCEAHFTVHERAAIVRQQVDQYLNR